MNAHERHVRAAQLRQDAEVSSHCRTLLAALSMAEAGKLDATLDLLGGMPRGLDLPDADRTVWLAIVALAAGHRAPLGARQLQEVR